MEEQNETYGKNRLHKGDHQLRSIEKRLEKHWNIGLL